ncbi:helix-turn-helix domain-containing protein [Agrilactobacillus fermenti]|uniref:helix-turn-helix domain-containing protein n=1 Tax=Agrilactobacillus fermenti TaxID=2586909 RepID=UPI001E5A3E99|nr:helix-turn-helix transcriptional regulator [Agrilactobacillus fermenti]MCD2256122.1 helix-turn-helix transcriptional regulator [Agrilactobacillus fermenti]
MGKQNLKVQIPTDEGAAKLSLPKDITQEQLEVFLKSLSETLTNLTQLNPSLTLNEKVNAFENDDEHKDHVVISGDEVGGFVTSVNDVRDEIAKKAGLFLRNYREKRALQRTEISEKTGMSYSSVFNLEKGASVPSLETLARFADVYGCDVKVTFIKNDGFDETKQA